MTNQINNISYIFENFPSPGEILKVTDNNVIEGWGEIWCNFPLTGAEHRAKLVDNVFSPLLTNHEINSPKETFAFLTL